MNVKLPKQVQEASDRADAQFMKANPEPPQAPAPSATDNPPAPSTPPEAASTAPEAPAPAPTEKPHTDWKAKYHTLQGMFNAEVPRLNEALKDAQARIAELEQRPAQPVPELPREPEQITLPPALVDALGEDAAKVIMESVSESTKRELDPIRSQVTEAGEQVKTTAEAQAEAAKQAFFHALTAKVPGWQTIDGTDEWKSWLAEQDRLSGQTRQELMLAAANNGDVDRVAAFFEAFQQLTPSQPAQPSREALLPQLTPDPGGTSQPADDKPSFSHGDITNFYKRVALGKIKPDEAAKIEQQIIAASGEGRVR